MSCGTLGKSTLMHFKTFSLQTIKLKLKDERQGCRPDYPSDKGHEVQMSFILQATPDYLFSNPYVKSLLGQGSLPYQVTFIYRNVFYVSEHATEHGGNQNCSDMPLFLIDLILNVN